MSISTKVFVTASKPVLLDLMPKLIKDLNRW